MLNTNIRWEEIPFGQVLARKGSVAKFDDECDECPAGETGLWGGFVNLERICGPYFELMGNRNASLKIPLDGVVVSQIALLKFLADC